MEQYTRVVMSRRIEVEKLIIHDVRKPGQRMPVRLRVRRKCPPDRFPGQALAEMGVFSDVAIVVEVNKGVLTRPVKHTQSNHHE